MTVLPVIERELRAEARHAFTYGSRTLGASVALIIFTALIGVTRLYRNLYHRTFALAI